MWSLNIIIAILSLGYRKKKFENLIKKVRERERGREAKNWLMSKVTKLLDERTKSACESLKRSRKWRELKSIFHFFMIFMRTQRCWANMGSKAWKVNFIYENWWVCNCRIARRTERNLLCSRIYFLLINLKSLLRDRDEHETELKFLSQWSDLDEKIEKKINLWFGVKKL